MQKNTLRLTTIKKTILVGLVLVIVATMAVATAGTMSAAYTDKDDNTSGQNAIDNYLKHKAKLKDDNPNNNGGQERALENLRDKLP